MNFVSRKLGERNVSVDVLRGLAIIGMILVNHAPPSPEIYGFLVHAPLTGWTLADTIFPIFLFLVGISIAFSQGGRNKGRSSLSYARIARRTALLVLINIGLVNFPYYEFSTLVVHGTLTRIAYCYLVASLLSHWFGLRTQLAVIAGILAVQWWFLTRFDVPGIGAGVFTVEGNASNYLDYLIFGGGVERLLLNGPIVQGLLPAASAIATTLIGVLTGQWIRSLANADNRVNGMFAIGLILFLLGNIWNVTYPVSKPLWTGSYVVLMAGLSLQMIALIDWLLAFRWPRRIGMAFRIAGVNALFFYVFAQLFQRVLVYGRVYHADGTSTRYKYLIYENWVEPWVSGKAGALIYVLIFLSICYAVAALLYRRQIFVKL